MQDKVFLEISNVSKTFPGVKALDNVKFSIKYGEVHLKIFYFNKRSFLLCARK